MRFESPARPFHPTKSASSPDIFVMFLPVGGWCGAVRVLQKRMYPWNVRQDVDGAFIVANSPWRPKEEGGSACVCRGLDNPDSNRRVPCTESQDADTGCSGYSELCRYVGDMWHNHQVASLQRTARMLPTVLLGNGATLEEGDERLSDGAVLAWVAQQLRVAPSVIDDCIQAVTTQDSLGDLARAQLRASIACHIRTQGGDGPMFPPASEMPTEGGKKWQAVRKVSTQPAAALPSNSRKRKSRSHTEKTRRLTEEVANGTQQGGRGSNAWRDQTIMYRFGTMLGCAKSGLAILVRIFRQNAKRSRRGEDGGAFIVDSARAVEESG